MTDNPLGKETKYIDKYDKSLLFVIPRSVQRELNETDKLPFNGFDLWTSFELSWLNKSGKPEVRIIRITYSAESHSIIESKSLKLYFGSFIMSVFESEKVVQNLIKKDLIEILKAPWLDVEILPPGKIIEYSSIDDDKLLDRLDIETSVYEVDPLLLLKSEARGEIVTLWSNLLKSNCPITGQPDWATVKIRYKSDKASVNEESLLKYIISFRNHQGYHEACCEIIFRDLFKLLEPQLLTVECCFTRRGGIDINPVRSYGEKADKNFNSHYWRQ